MGRPRMLDLFCGGGGAGVGYARAGFDVTGVDIRPQAGYPFAFHQSDALEFLAAHGSGFDVIHASPPCQGYSTSVKSGSSPWTPTKGWDEPRLIGEVRAALEGLGKPYVMENVMGSRNDLAASLLLCGAMFGLPISRHRLFESSHLIPQPHHPRCRGIGKRYAEERGWEWRDVSCTGKGRRTGTTEKWKEILQIDWSITQLGLTECIPPAFTEFIGGNLMRVLRPSLTQAAGG